MEYNDLKNLFLTQYGLAIGNKIASGGSGTVYALEDQENQVLKVVDINENARRNTNEGDDEMFSLYQEVFLSICQDELTRNEKLAKTRSDYFVYITKPYTIVSESQNLCLCAMKMPYYDTLRSFHDEGKLSEEMVIRLGMHMCEALKVLHFDAKEVFYRRKKDRMGIILHMDLKPDNIFYKEENGNVIFKLGDFGATVDKIDELFWATSEGYGAPETDDDDAIPTEHTDIFSLGMVLYYCFCEETDRREVFERVKAFRGHRCLGEEQERPEKCSPELWNIILKATAAQKEERYQSAEEMLSALQAVGEKKTKNFEEKAEIAEERAEIAEQDKEMAQAVAMLAGTVAVVEGVFIAANKVKEKFKGETMKLVVQASGDIYEGGVKDGLPSGKGTYTYQRGEETCIIKGRWKWIEQEFIKVRKTTYLYQGMKCNGKHSGWCRVIGDKGQIYEGTICDGFLEKGMVKFLDGTTREIDWRDNIKL